MMFSTRPIWILAIALVGFSSCKTREIQVTCGEELPRFESTLLKGALALEDLVPEGMVTSALAKHLSKRNREPAEIKAPKTLAKPLYRIKDKEVMETWADWALDRLVEIQSYMDDVKIHPELRHIQPDLMALADEAVLFHGYAEFGKLEKMQLILDRMIVQEKRIYAKLCSQLPTKSQEG